MKIIHLPTSVGGMAWGLSRGERSLGLDSSVLVQFNNSLQYPADKILFQGAPHHQFEKVFYLYKIIREIYDVKKKYNVFHFNYGSTMLDLNYPGFPPLLDLPLYKKKGRIIVTYNGCDARLKYPTMNRTLFSACHNPECYNGICNSGEFDKLRKRKIEKFNDYADAIFAVNPDLLYFLPQRARFLPYVVANWDKINTCPFKLPVKKFKIVHAPTNRIAKGSSIIIDVLEKLKLRYNNILEFTLVENMPNIQACKIYSEADLIIDQILIGWYGGFSVEAMKMGKPVMAFVREEDLKFLPQDMARDCLNAIINVNPQTLFEKMCLFIENPELLKHHREAALYYVNKWHDSQYVASITKAAYEG